MEYKYYNNLCNEFNIFRTGSNFDFLKNDSLWVISLQDSDCMFVVKKIVKDDAEGVAVLFGIDSMYTLYLLEHATSSYEQAALLADRRYCLLLNQNVENIPYNLRMYNSAAGIPEEDGCQFFCGYVSKCGNLDIPDETYSSLLLKVLTLINSVNFDEEVLKKGFASDFGVLQVWDKEGWERIVKKGLNGEVGLAFNLNEKDRLFLAQLEPKLKLTSLVFEVDYNLIDVVDNKIDSHKEILVTVLSSNEDKCLSLDDVKADSDIATSVIKAIISAAVAYKYPYKIICKKRSVYMWLKHICDSLNIEIELVEKLVATEALYAKLKSEKRYESVI